MAEVTQEDVKLLYSDASPQRRSVLAAKLAHELKTGSLSETETDLAIAICQQLAEDVEVSVRQSLSHALRDSKDIPHALALQLAEDVLEVSIPMLEFSDLLDDTDLIAIVRQGDSARQLAISHRPALSPSLSYTLCEEGDEDVVDSVLKNDGAELIEDAYRLILKRFEHSGRLHKSMAARPQLPPRVIDMMVDVISDQLKAYLLASQNLSSVLIEKVILESREDAKRRLMHDPMSKRDAQALVISADRQGKLTNELIFRALEIGDRAFFEYAMAHKVNISVEAARTLIKDPGEKGFSALYQKAKMPKAEFSAISYMVDVEYRSHSHKPITAKRRSSTTTQEPESWLTETENQKNKWRLF